MADGPLESFTNAFKGDKTGAAIGGAVSGEGKEKTGVSVSSRHALSLHGIYSIA